MIEKSNPQYKIVIDEALCMTPKWLIKCMTPMFKASIKQYCVIELTQEKVISENIHESNEKTIKRQWKDAYQI